MKTKAILLLNACLITSVLTLNSQIINIDTTFVSDGEIYPFSQDDTIKGLKISGNVGGERN